MKEFPQRWTQIDMQALSLEVASWIKDYMDKDGIETCVVGVSGGVDSAAILRLCERTGKRVIAVAMPMELHKDSSADSLQKAMELCVNRPNVELIIRPIGQIVKCYQKQGVGLTQLGEGNLRSRTRADILRDLAGETNGIVVGTGNRDEDEIGYFTKGGDGDVDICPLSQLHKSMVKAIAVCEGVPEKIITAEPTAGLWDGQTDEEELGMNYNEVEWAIRFDDNEINATSTPQELQEAQDLSDRQVKVLGMVRTRRRVNAHKLRFPSVFTPEWLSK
jgi:NAD+ synthase